MRVWPWFALAMVLGMSNAARADDAAGAFAYRLTSIDGAPMPLSAYAGKALLVVNTASMCGYTPQYAGLQKLWTTYRDRGLVLIGVPSDDFNQELATNGEVKTFCEVNFDVDFPLAEKVHVRGADADPLFAWLASKGGAGKAPAWNFFKYLIGSDGKAITVWPSGVEPNDPAIAAAIEKALGKVS